MKILIKYCVLIFLLFGCFPFGESNEHIVGRYYLGYLDGRDYMSIEVESKKNKGSYRSVITPTVFEIGFNENFIIAKQHPKPDFSKPMDKSVINYFIIPLKFRVSEWDDLNRIGPLTRKEFIDKRKELKISDSLTFTRVFKDLE
jgi:hypothetical protein